jgi:hypothetical protein
MSINDRYYEKVKEIMTVAKLIEDPKTTRLIQKSQQQSVGKYVKYLGWNITKNITLSI